jgi:hypothetical protein
MTPDRANDVVNHAAGMCAGKASFVTRREAKTTLNRNGYKGKPYHCQLCGMWHITSRDKGYSKRIKHRISTARRQLAA